MHTLNHYYSMIIMECTLKGLFLYDMVLISKYFCIFLSQYLRYRWFLPQRPNRSEKTKARLVKLFYLKLLIKSVKMCFTYRWWWCFRCSDHLREEDLYWGGPSTQAAETSSVPVWDTESIWRVAGGSTTHSDGCIWSKVASIVFTMI